MTKRAPVQANYPASCELEWLGGVSFAAPDIVAAEPGAKPKLRQFSMHAYTGGQMDIFGWKHPVVLDLQGMQAGDKSRPIYLSHSGGDIVGHTNAVRIDSPDVFVDGVVSGGGNAAREVVTAADNGFPWQASVGVRAQRVEEVKQGEKANANGREFNGPVLIVRGSILKEISFVPLGADDNTSARIAAGAKGHNMNNSDIAVSAAAPEPDANNLGAANGTTATITFNSDPSATLVATADQFRAEREQRAAELERVAAIQRVAKDHPAIAAKAIREGWDINAAELAVIRARPDVPAVGTAAPSLSPAVAEASMLMASGMTEEDVVKGSRGRYSEQVMNEAVSQKYRGIGFHRIIAEVCASQGIHVHPGRIDNDTLRSALTIDKRMVEAGVAFSTLSLSGTLSNAANKRLKDAFASVPNYTIPLAEQIDTNDFKQFNNYNVFGPGIFDKLGIDGTLKLGPMQEEAYPNQVDTYGRILVVSRQNLINDDLGVFMTSMARLGRGAITALNKAFFTMWLANAGAPAFFSAAAWPAGHANLITGATSTLTVTGLGLAEQKFLSQVDPLGDPVVATPKTLLVPTALKAVADQLYTSQYVYETTASSGPNNDKIKPAGNPWMNRFAPLAVPYLDALSIPGSSATAWYLVGDPNDIAAAQVAYLRGQRTPVVESAETDFTTLGMQFRGYWDFGVAFQDPRGAVKSNGA